MKTMFGTCAVLLFAVLTLACPPAGAQTQGAGADTTSITSPKPPPPVQEPSAAGPFARGNKRVGFYGGAGSTLGQTYVILGGGMSYFVADGLEAGADFEGWILQDPTIWKLTPQIRYTVWKAPRLQPYVGAFYRRTFIGDPYDDFNSYGGRGGVTYRKGKGYAGVGMVYERYSGDVAGDRDTWYPEVSFAIIF